MAQKQPEKMGIEGAGPMIMAPAALYFMVAAIVSYMYRPAFDLTFVPREITLGLAAVLLVVGIPLWLAAVGYFLLAWRKGEMATKKGIDTSKPVDGRNWEAIRQWTKDVAARAR